MAKKHSRIPDKVEQTPEDEKASKEHIKEIAALYNLDKQDQDLLRLVLSYPGIKPKQLAAIVGLTKPQVDYRLKKPSIIRALSDYRAPTTKLIDDMTRKATRRLMELMDAPDLRMRARACEIALKHLNQYNLYISKTMQGAQGEGAQPPLVQIYANVVRDDGELIKKIVELQVGEWEKVQTGEKTMDDIKRERGLLTQKDIEIMEGLKDEKRTMDAASENTSGNENREAGTQDGDPEPVGA